MNHRVTLIFSFTLLSLITSGCRLPYEVAPPLPKVEWNSPEDARAILIQRQQAVQTVQAECKIKFTSAPPENKANSFDGAVVMDRKGQFRIRTWKLNQTIFDITVNQDGTWVLTNNEFKKRAPDAGSDLGKLGQIMPQLFNGPDFAQATYERSIGKTGTAQADVLMLEWLDDQNQTAVLSSLESQTLATQWLTIFPGDAEREVFVEPQHRYYDDLYWLDRVTAEGAFGKIEIDFHNVKLNGELNPRAFKPSRRAVRVDEDAAAGQGNTQP